MELMGVRKENLERDLICTVLLQPPREKQNLGLSLLVGVHGEIGRYLRDHVVLVHPLPEIFADDDTSYRLGSAMVMVFDPATVSSKLPPRGLPPAEAVAKTFVEAYPEADERLVLILVPMPAWVQRIALGPEGENVALTSPRLYNLQGEELAQEHPWRRVRRLLVVEGADEAEALENVKLRQNQQVLFNHAAGNGSSQPPTGPAPGNAQDAMGEPG